MRGTLARSKGPQLQASAPSCDSKLVGLLLCFHYLMDRAFMPNAEQSAACWARRHARTTLSCGICVQCVYDLISVHAPRRTEAPFPLVFEDGSDADPARDCCRQDAGCSTMGNHSAVRYLISPASAMTRRTTTSCQRDCTVSFGHNHRIRDSAKFCYQMALRFPLNLESCRAVQMIVLQEQF